MGNSLSSEVTALLDRWSDGDPEALDELVPMVWNDIRDIARRQLAHESPRHTLQPTALVNEVYMRLENRRAVSWKTRGQFFGFLVQLVRRILIDHARGRRRAKRGLGKRPLPLDEVFGLAQERSAELIALDDALVALEGFDARQARVVELRYFMGLTFEEIAEVMEMSLSTVSRDWKAARMWLLRELDRSA